MKAPLIITVGPPCSGKTSWLRQTYPQAQDVALDDQPGVYAALPRSYFLDKDSITNDSTVLFGTKLADRISGNDQTELCLVTKYLSGAIESDEFTKQIGVLHQSSTATADLIVSAVDSRRKDDLQMPDTIDLFVRQALFVRNEESESAIERATRIIRESDSSQAVAWGNTNTKPRDYAEILEYAARSERPVEFCVYADAGMKCYTTLKECLSISTCSGVSELYHRNVQRFLETGRYIPAAVICDMYKRTEELLSTLPVNLSTKQELNIALIEAAGFRGRSVEDSTFVDQRSDFSSRKRGMAETDFDRSNQSKRRPNYLHQSDGSHRPHENREAFRHTSRRGGDFRDSRRVVPQNRSNEAHSRWIGGTTVQFRQRQESLQRPGRPWDKNANFHTEGRRAAGWNQGARTQFERDQIMPHSLDQETNTNTTNWRHFPTQHRRNEGYTRTRHEPVGRNYHSSRDGQAQDGHREDDKKRDGAT